MVLFTSVFQFAVNGLDGQAPDISTELKAG
jgi:hypothetical protein